MWVTTKRVFLKSIKFTVYLKTPPHLLLWDESAWSVSQWSRNSYSKFLEKKNTPSQRSVINSLLAVVARKKRICHSELSLFGYLGYSDTGTFTSTICTNANYFSASTLELVTLVYRAQSHSSYKNCNNKGPVNHRKNTQIYICMRTVQPGSQKILHKADSGRASRTRCSVQSRLLCGYATDTKRD